MIDWGFAVTRRVVAVVGSYRKGGTIDTAVQAILDGAREKGAKTHTFYLREMHLEYCTNCRRCTQEPGTQRGHCVQRDDMESILLEIDSADAIVLGSPVNCWNVTARFRQFMERLVGFVYWPWGANGPVPRNKRPQRRAVLVASSAAPGFCIPLVTGAGRALRETAKLLGAKTVDHLWIGLAAKQPHQALSPRVLAHARRIGINLV